jgi:prevent-host-death family protein
MAIHVNIGEAKTRLSQLVAAAVRGEEVVLQKSGRPQVRLVAVDDASRAELEAIAKRRVAAFGKFKEAFAGVDLSLDALKADRPDPDERERRALGLDL